MTSPPARPRLRSHVLARRHLANGRELVVLYDSERLRNHRASERTWLVLNGMDGTRDVDGLVAFATSHGATVGAEEVRDLVQDLANEEMIADGIDLSPERPSVAPPSADDAPRAVLALPDFALDCDGQGTCCRFYPSIAFSALDAARARAARPEVLEGGNDAARVFLPLFGRDPRAHAVSLVDGRCAYLASDLGCTIHSVAGAGQKPLGCRTYPARFVDDGEHVRVSPWPECRCVLQSGALGSTSQGEPLVSPSVTSTRELDPAFHVERLPPTIAVAPGKTAERAELAAWSRAVFDAPVKDAIASLVALAESLEAHGLDVDASRASLIDPPSPDAGVFAAAAAAFMPRIARLAAEDWRAPNDMVRMTATALESACLLLESLALDLLASPPAHAEAERFYVKDLLFGHHAVHRQGLHPMSVLLFDRAFRVVLGRALGIVANVADLHDPAFQMPLALVDATMRGYGVNAYVQDLALSPAQAR
ncbi:MAG: YkgJ family cysteine cluster protein [Polyangiaceae bacterium]|nr:YkgJ family cysteine cluster protein [Polyangiaceae bacterium]